jgi:hypothetical protein
MRTISPIWLGLFLLVSTVLLSACTLFDKHSVSGIQINTNDIPSNIFLNDTHVGKSALVERNLKPGIYSLKIHPDDPSYVPYETTITLHRGVMTIVAWKPGTKPELSGGVIYELEPLNSKSTEVSFVTIPDGAIIQFAGKEKEFAPYVFTDVQPGHVEFEVTLPSYEVQKHTIDIIPGHRMHISVKLAKLRSADEELMGEGIPNASDSGSPANLATGSAQATQSAQLKPGPSIAPPASASGIVKINPTGYFDQGIEVLRVRSLPGSGVEIGVTPVGSTLPYMKETQAGWLKVWFNGQLGWVSGQYAEVTQ